MDAPAHVSFRPNCGPWKLKDILVLWHCWRYETNSHLYYWFQVGLTTVFLDDFNGTFSACLDDLMSRKNPEILKKFLPWIFFYCARACAMSGNGDAAAGRAPSVADRSPSAPSPAHLAEQWPPATAAKCPVSRSAESAAARHGTARQLATNRPVQSGQPPKTWPLPLCAAADWWCTDVHFSKFD